MGEELDMKGLFFKLANAEQEGEDAVMDRKKITRALKALGITDEFKTEDVLNSMDANGDGTIDLEEWTTCMTPELKRAIYRSLANPDKLNGFQPLVDVAKVFDQFDTDNSGSLSKEEIKYACNCLGLKAWDIEEFFTGLDRIRMEKSPYRNSKITYRPMYSKLCLQNCPRMDLLKECKVYPYQQELYRLSVMPRRLIFLLVHRENIYGL